MLKVVAAVYLLNFLGVGPSLVPFDSMAACIAAHAKIQLAWTFAPDVRTSAEQDMRMKKATELLVCVKGK